MSFGSSPIGASPIAGSGTTAAVTIPNYGTVVLPAAVVAATQTFHGYAMVNLPMLTTAGYGGANAAVSLPALRTAAFGKGGGAVTLPQFDLRITGGPGRNLANLLLPAMTAAARTGHQGAVVLPSMTVAATMTSVGWGKSAISLPAMLAASSGTTTALANAALTLPMVTMTSVFGEDAAITLPMAKVAAAGNQGALGKANLQLPMLVAASGATMQNVGSAAITLPMLDINDGRINVGLTLPAMQAVAIGGQVVSVTYEAYSINLTHRELKRNEEPIDEVTRYTNFPFKDIVRLGNDYFGVNDNGMFKLGGATDFDAATPLAPDEVPWAWRTAITDFNSPYRKTPASAYFAGRFAPDATITVYAGETGSVSYAYTTPRGIGAQNYRQKFGRGLRERYYAFGAEGTATLSLDMIEFDLNILTRRL